MLIMAIACSVGPGNVQEGGPMSREVSDCKEISYDSGGALVRGTLCYPAGEQSNRGAVIYLHGSAAETPPPPGFPYALDDMMPNFL